MHIITCLHFEIWVILDWAHAILVNFLSWKQYTGRNGRSMENWYGYRHLPSRGGKSCGHVIVEDSGSKTKISTKILVLNI